MRDFVIEVQPHTVYSGYDHEAAGKTDSLRGIEVVLVWQDGLIIDIDT